MLHNSETWDLVTVNRDKTGLFHRRGDDVPRNLYHIVVEVWTVIDNHMILMTQRHKDKPWGLLWECTGGSILTGETSLQGAIREVREEIGLAVTEGNLELVYNYIGDDSIYDVYVNYSTKEEVQNIVMEEYEVIDYKIISISDFYAMLERNEIIPKLSYFSDLIRNGKIRLTIAST